METEITTAGQKPNIEGSPEATNSNPAGAGQTAATTAPVEKKTIYSGIGGNFETPEELAEYTKNIEAQLITEKARPHAQAPLPTQSTTPGNPEEAFYEGVETELFANPKETVKKIVEKARSEVRLEMQRDASTKTFWEGFYSENPDLKSLETVVRSIVAEKKSEIDPLKISDAKAFIAKEARKVITAVRAQAGITETQLQSGGATVIASGSPVSTRPAADGEGKVISFIEQVQAQRASRQRPK